MVDKTRLVVETKCGKLNGAIESGGSYAFKAVPFAKPPVGALRGRAPQSPEAWDGERDASEFGPMAIQQGFPPKPGAPLSGQEDCLYLNVWRPAPDSEKKRPVLLWIHGGAFVFGSGIENLYNGDQFAAAGDLVYVSINYRLGGWGFFLNDRDPASPNLGILDQIAALRWVKDNIAAFGGDPDNVTIMGESAGAMSVAILAGTPAAEGLFKKVIVQSGGARPFFCGDEPRQIQEIALKAAGAKSIGDFMKMDALDMNHAFEAVSGDSNNATFGGEPFHPSLDGVTYKTHPLNTMRKHPMLIGHCDREIGFFINGGATALLEGLPKRMRAQVGDALWNEILETYERFPREGAPWKEDIFNACFAVIPAVRLADKLRAIGADCWSYQFDYKGADPTGAIHTSDTPYTYNAPGKKFGGVGRLWNAREQALGRQMRDAMIAFCHNGKPDHPGLPAWPMHDEQLSYMSFSLDSVAKTDFVNPERRKVWEKAPMEAI